MTPGLGSGSLKEENSRVIFVLSAGNKCSKLMIDLTG